MSEVIDLSVVIPTLNEEKNIGPLIAEIHQVLRGLKINYEILVIDGGSSDRTVDEALSQNARCTLQRRPGYGGALREGFMSARGKFVLTLDSDRSHPPSLFPKMWEKRSHGNIVIASRYVAGGSSEASLFRRSLSTVLNTIFRLVLDVPVSDSSSGFRLYERRLLTPSDYSADNFNILQEILVKAYSDGYSIEEEALHFKDRFFGQSHVELIRFARSYLGTLYSLWKLRNSVLSADYDERAFKSRIPLQRYWQRTRHRIVLGYINPQAATLDVGCGSSRIIQDLPEAVAVDIVMRKLRFLAKSNRLRVCASTFSLPFADQAFEQIIHSQVIEHIPFSPSILFELNRVLREDGILVIGTPDYGRIWWPIIEFFYQRLLPNAYADEHITHYTRKMLFDLLADYGFRVLSYSYILGGELIVKAKKVEAVVKAP